MEEQSNASVRQAFDGLRLRIFILEGLQYHHQPLHEYLVQRARTAGLAGATVFHGIEGFGSRRHLHTSRLVDAADNLPMVVEIVDRPEAIRAFVDSLEDVIEHGTMTLTPVQVLRPTLGPKVGDAPGRAT